jgi:ribonuclease HI
MELILYRRRVIEQSGGGAGFVSQDGKPVEKIARYLGMTTNNIAEYSAAIIGLEYAVKLGAGKVKLRADSELLVKQVNGLYKVKNEGLKPLHARVKELIAKIACVEVEYIPRERNKEADALANKAIDEKIK